jgi:hypothetical protein
MAVLLAGVSLVMVAAIYFMRSGSDTPAFSINESSVKSAPTALPALPQAQAAAGGDSLSFISGKDGLLKGGGSGAAGTSPVSASDRAREKQFLAQYDGAIRQYQARLNEIGMRYYKKNPIVRQVDADFAGMSRYMAIKHRYEADRDAYQWARDTAALPEVRITIRKYLSNPQAWEVAVDMALEALKQPPPAPVYKEITNFMVSDPAMLTMTKNVASDAQPNLSMAVTAVSGKDISPIQKVMSDLNINGR